jgi:membrane-associated protein
MNFSDNSFGNFYNRYGIRAFNMGRFMPVICTLVPKIAGCSSHQLRKILILNLAGSKVRIGTLVPPGYFTGRSYRQIITHSAWVLLGFILIASIPVFQILVFNK